MPGAPEANVFINYQAKNMGVLDQGNAKMGQTTQRVMDTQQAMMNLVNSITVVSNKINEFGTRSVNTFASFDQGMANVKSIVSGTNEEVEKLEGLAQQMGRDMPILGEEAASGFYELASAGKDANAIMDLAPQITKAAIAANTDFATTAKLVTAAQDTWGLSNKRVNLTTDILLSTVKNFKTTLPELSISMQYAMTTASQLGVSMETAGASIGTLRQMGLDASMAGSGLRNTMSMLAQATSTSNESLAVFAETLVTNSDGSMNFTATLSRAQKLLSNYGPIERQALLAGAFGRRNASATAILIENAGAIERQSKVLAEGGTVLEAYDKQMEGAGNKLKILQGRMEEQERIMGEKLLPTQVAINDAQIKFLEILNDLPGPMGQVVVGTGMIFSNVMQMIGPLALATNAIIGLTGAQWGLNAAMFANPVGLVVLAIVALVAIVTIATVMIIKGSKGVKLFGLALLYALGPIGLVVILILLLTGKLKFMNDVLRDVGDFFKHIASEIDRISGGFVQWYDPLLLLLGPIGMLILLFLRLGTIIDFAKDVWEGFAWVFEDQIETLKSRFGDFIDLIKGLPRTMKDAFVDGVSSIINTIRNFGKNMYTGGKEFLSKFVDGIVDQVSSSTGILGDAVKKISGFFGGSPPEFGPLKDAMESGGPAFINKWIGNMSGAMGGARTTYNYYKLDARSNNSFGSGMSPDDFVDQMMDRLMERFAEMSD